MKLTRTAALLLLLPLAIVLRAEPPSTVIVGGYHFQPYVRANFDGTGITRQLIELMNEAQSDYRFVFTPIPAKRRYQYVTEGKVDLMIFEEPRWGWAAYDVEFSQPLRVKGKPYRDRDLFIALKSNATDQRYFDNLRAHQLVMARGHHYEFAGFNADETLLKKRYQALIVSQPESVIRMILEGRGEIGVVSHSLIQDFLRSHPLEGEQLLLSERVDHHHNLLLVLGPQAAIDKATIDALLSQMEQSGSLEALLRQHQLID